MRSVLLAAALAAAAAAPALAQRAKTARVELTVSGLKDRQGKLQGGLFATPATFPVDGEAAVPFNLPLRSLRCRAVDDAQTCVVRLPRVKPGQYAIAVAHDRNGDGEIERSPFSSERKGASGYDSKLLSVPKWDKAVVAVRAPVTRLKVEVN